MGKSINYIRAIIVIAIMLCVRSSMLAHDLEGNGLYYNILSESDKTLEVTFRGSTYFEYDDEYSGEVIIPSSVTYNDIIYSVTKIGENAFNKCMKLTSIFIPNSVTEIGVSAFFNCICLESISIPKTVTKIAEGSFVYCNSLKSIVVDNGNEVYDSRNNCNVIVHTSTNTLITAGCENTTIPNTVKRIGNYAFSNNRKLNSISIPNSVVEIGDYALNGSDCLTSVSIPNSVTKMGDCVFSYCYDLKYASIPNYVETIGSFAFDNTNITSVNIPKSLNNIGSGVFAGCRNLTSIVVNRGNTTYDSRNDCNAIVHTSTNTLVAGCRNTIIPKSVTIIGEGAFYNCYKLTSIVIPNSVNRIEAYAFHGCSSLSSIVIPKSVTKIGNAAFACCSGLTEVVIPEYVTEIGYGAFYGCYNLKTVTIMNPNTQIAETAFHSCGNVKILKRTKAKNKTRKSIPQRRRRR